MPLHTSPRAWLPLAPALAILLLAAAASMAAAQDPGRRLLAGAATSNITPPLGDLIVGNWEAAPATHVHDELHARSLVLDDGSVRLAIVVADNLGLPQPVVERARRLASERTGIPADRILIAATHTHSATGASGPARFDPSMPLDDYQLFLAQRIADGIQRAVNNLEPARIGWSRGALPEQVFNRRWFMKAGPHLANPFGGQDRVRMNPPAGSPDLIEPAGPTDPEIGIVSVSATDGRPIALIANYSLHYVGGVPAGHISADYFGAFARRMTALLDAGRADPPFVAMLSNGTSGDINNIDFRGGQKRLPPYKRIELVANQVAGEVFRALQGVEYHDWAPLGIERRDLDLQTRLPAAELSAWAAEVLSDPEPARAEHPRARIYADRIQRMRGFPAQLTVPLEAVRIGDLAIAGIPFEVFVEIGLEIKSRSPFPQTFVMSLANGAYGYLPTARQHELGGYETWLGTNVVETGAAQKIVDALLGMLQRLR